MPFSVTCVILTTGDNMKNKIIKIVAFISVLILLNSCGNQNVLKTEEITNKITQTQVVTVSELSQTEEFNAFLSDFKADFIIPGLFEGIIPQGLCYIESLNIFAVSGYYEEAKFPSMLMLIDAESGKLTKTFPLQNVDGNDYFGHAGGLACSDEYIYITSESTCNILPVDILTKTRSGDKIKFESNFKLNTKGSFACYEKGVLWTGDFIESSDKARGAAGKITTLTSGETFYAYCEGYVLKDNLPDIKNINSSNNGYIPDYMIAIPEQVQGMSFTPSGKVIFSTSYGRKNNSKIYVYDDVLLTERVGIYTIDEKEINLFAFSNDLLKETIIAPPMAEGIARKDNEQIIIFESGAEKYRNHRGKFPTDTAFKSNIE